MNPIAQQLAKDAGFELWADEPWRPPGQVVDWSSVYDRELEMLVTLTINKCIAIVERHSKRDDDMGAIIAANIRKELR